MVAKIEVFDPPMCCSTGVCGGNVNPKLVEFAQSLETLQKNGVAVSRYNFAQNQAAFMANEEVLSLINKEGDTCLPLIFVDGALQFQGTYPTYNELVSTSKETKNVTKEKPASSSSPCCCAGGCSCHSADAPTWKKWLFLIAVIAVLATIAWRLRAKDVSSADKSSDIGTIEQLFTSKIGQQSVGGKTVGGKTVVSKTVVSKTVVSKTVGGKTVGASGKKDPPTRTIAAFNDLNAQALNFDAVFVYLPQGNGGESIGKEDAEIIQSAIETLAKSEVFVLKKLTPDYNSFSQDVQKSPALLVVTKKGGFKMISLPASVAQLLQT